MRFLTFLWWRFNPPVSVRVYYRAVRNPFGHELFDAMMLKTCFEQCTPLEQAFIRATPPGHGEMTL